MACSIQVNCGVKSVTMSIWILVGLGGALGSMLRHGVNHVMTRVSPNLALPYATFAVNLAGCFVIGVLSGLLASQRIAMTHEARAFVFVGVLGGFTTFSSFGLDTFTLFQAGLRLTAVWNIAGQVGLGLLAVYAGFFLGTARG
jgi:CrcB protein